ncbi:hypothetical protein LPZ50_21125, partial [Bordetella petrii]|nr:hypothetical protein [Bordetella petrii]
GNAASAAPSADELGASLRREGLTEDTWTLAEGAVPADGGKTAPGPALTLTLREASSAVLFRWLDTAARDWRLDVASAELTRATLEGGRRLPGRLSGTLTLISSRP